MRDWLNKEVPPVHDPVVFHQRELVKDPIVLHQGDILTVLVSQHCLGRCLKEVLHLQINV